MIQIQVLWWSSHESEGIKRRGYWDQGVLEEVIFGQAWRSGLDARFTHLTDPASLISDGAVVVIPARHHINDISEINEVISSLPWV
ncbi:MAG TPA: hypothetical protein VGC99_29530, partial [Candidatus Tectomicrobia bacterium]